MGPLMATPKSIGSGEIYLSCLLAVERFVSLFNLRSVNTDINVFQRMLWSLEGCQD